VAAAKYNMRKTLITTTALVLAFTLAVFGVGEVLSAPSKSIIGPPPSELAGKSVSFADSTGRVIAGWFSRGQPGQGSVLLLHGVRSDRRQMLARAMYLHASGYSVLLVDLQGHGESGGDRITFGYREAEGVKAAIKFLRDTAPKEKIAVIGVSLGAAAFTLSSVTPPPSAVMALRAAKGVALVLASQVRVTTRHVKNVKNSATWSGIAINSCVIRWRELITVSSRRHTKRAWIALIESTLNVSKTVQRGANRWKTMKKIESLPRVLCARACFLKFEAAT